MFFDVYIIYVITKGSEVMSMSKKIKQLLVEKSLSITNLASLLDTTPQNLSNKLSRNNFTENDLYEIAEALHVKYEAKFVIEDEFGNKIKEI